MTRHSPAPRGLLLAAGAGRRLGQPKALARDRAGRSWLTRSVDVLQQGGCGQVTVVLGAAAAEAAELVTDMVGVETVIAEDWESGMGASLSTGLAALSADPEVQVALVHLVDLPDVGTDAIARVVQAADGPSTLARASYFGAPGHPVLLGRDHWAGVAESATGDWGARSYLAENPPREIECHDLATGRDVDTPAEALAIGTDSTSPAD